MRSQIAAAGALVLALAREAPADPPAALALCIRVVAPVSGLDAPALLAECEAVGAKWGVRCVAACPAADPGPGQVVVAVGPGDTAVLSSASGDARVDVSRLDPRDRAQDVARLALALHVSAAGGPPSPVVEPGLAAPLRAAPPDAVPPDAAPPDAAMLVPQVPRIAASPRFHALAGVTAAYQRSSSPFAWRVEVEPGLALFGERLLIAVRAGWQPPADLSGSAVPARWQAVPVTAGLRGGFRVGMARLRAGVAGGVEWRRIEARPSGRPAPTPRTDAAGVLDGEVEAIFAPIRVLRVGVSLTVRGYVGGDSYAWNGDTVLDAPGLSVGLGLRVGACVGPGGED
jgi:hypothetical protein